MFSVSSLIGFAPKKPGRGLAEPKARRYAFDFTHIPDAVCKVAHTLASAGHETYLVGGCVRDALLDLHPKDFDIATAALPEQVKKLFGRQASIIGRRFRIVHIHAGKQVIEVTTFRGNSEEKHHLRSQSGQILLDNNFGQVHEDAVRRDLSINALYYDLKSREIVDFVGGYADIRKKRIRLIGDPLDRFIEDPVRMLRCIRFAAKMDIDLPKDLHRLVCEHAGLLRNVTSSRMLGEFLKLHTYPALERAIDMCRATGVLAALFPGSNRILEGKDALAKQSNSLLTLALRNTDQRLRVNGRVSQFYLIGVLLWPMLRKLTKEKNLTQFVIHQAGQKVLKDVHTIKIPKTFVSRMFNVWTLQLRLQYPHPRSIHWILEHKDFRAAYDFLQLRESAGEIAGPAPSAWWRSMQEADRSQRQQLIEALPRLAHTKNRQGFSPAHSVFDPDLQDQQHGAKRMLDRTTSSLSEKNKVSLSGTYTA